MRILFDQGTPAPLRLYLIGHEVVTAYEAGWSKLENGKLLAAAETKFEIMITTDQSLGYQQNLSLRKLAILVLPTTNWLFLQGYAGEILVEINRMKSGEYRELKLEK